jgi:hypothetical protein
MAKESGRRYLRIALNMADERDRNLWDRIRQRPRWMTVSGLIRAALDDYLSRTDFSRLPPTDIMPGRRVNSRQEAQPAPAPEEAPPPPPDRPEAGDLDEFASLFADAAIVRRASDKKKT